MEALVVLSVLVTSTALIFSAVSLRNVGDCRQVLDNRLIYMKATKEGTDLKCQNLTMQIKDLQTLIDQLHEREERNSAFNKANRNFLTVFDDNGEFVRYSSRFNPEDKIND